MVASRRQRFSLENIFAMLTNLEQLEQMGYILRDLND